MINGCYKYCNSHFVDTNEKKYRNEDKYMIHKFKAKGLNILLDVNSGGVHLIDDVTYDLLDHAQPPFEEECPTKYIDALKTDYSEEEIKESYADIVALYHDKLLFSEDIYGDFANTAVESPIKAMCLHIAHDCNLRCKYCFAPHIRIKILSWYTHRSPCIGTASSLGQLYTFSELPLRPPEHVLRDMSSARMALVYTSLSSAFSEAFLVFS